MYDFTYHCRKGYQALTRYDLWAKQGTKNKYIKVFFKTLSECVPYSAVALNIEDCARMRFVWFACLFCMHVLLFACLVVCVPAVCLLCLFVSVFAWSNTIVIFFSMAVKI